MDSIRSSSRIKKWLSLERIVPVFVIVGAGIAIVLDMLKIIDLTISEDIIISLLGLLAFDALTERLGILTKILSKLEGVFQLKDRNGFPAPLEKRMAEARQVDIIGVNLSGFIAQYRGLFTTKGNDGCKFRIVIVDPEFFTLKNLPSSWYGTKVGGEQTIRHVIQLIEKIALSVGNSQVELKFTSFPPPYNMLMINPNHPNGEVQVELYTHDGNPHHRPHFLLTREHESKWYDFYLKEFENVWENGKLYEFKLPQF